MLNLKFVIFGSRGMLGTEFMNAVPSNNIIHSFDKHNINIFDKKEILNKLKKYKFDWIVNCAAYTNVEKAEIDYHEAYKGNVEIPKILVEVANELNIGICHFSTDYVFDGTKNKSYKENDSTNPINNYGKTKLLGEYQIQKAYKYLICRISWLYGPYGNCFPKAIIRQLKSDKFVDVVNDQIGTPTYTFDVVSESIILMTTNRCGTYHISNSGQASWYDFAKEIAKYYNLEDKVSPISSNKLTVKAKRPLYSVMSSEKMEREIGIKPQHWKFALKRFLNQIQGE